MSEIARFEPGVVARRSRQAAQLPPAPEGGLALTDEFLTRQPREALAWIQETLVRQARDRALWVTVRRDFVSNAWFVYWKPASDGVGRLEVTE